MLKCQVCGKRIPKPHRGQKFCSLKCNGLSTNKDWLDKRDAARGKRTCGKCGVEREIGYYSRPTKAGVGLYDTCRVCREAAWRERVRVMRTAATDAGPDE